MKKPDLDIRVVTTDPFTKWVRAIIFLAVAVVVPVGLGILADSAAMQWVGFVMAILCILGKAVGEGNKQTFHSYQEARNYLSRMEQESMK